MKNLIALSLAGTLALASCGGPSVTGPSEPGPSPISSALGGTVFEGQIRADSNGQAVLSTGAWTGGAGSAVLSRVDSSADGSAPAVLISTSLGAEGRFAFATLPAPAASALGDFNDSPSASCTGTISVSDPAARGTSAFVSVSAQKAGSIGLLALNSATQTISEGILIYADRAVRMTGRQTCATAGGSSTTDVNLQLSPGWNMTSLSLQDASTLTIRNGAPVEAQWIFLNEGKGGLTGQHLQSVSTFSLFR
ncbi:hypothetical protein [Deinococcus aerophilus]|uniref:Uncharacterized protein n=1 Tax=Deinococcus aerophilus TaxID=522488 RepID=A0ABQ2GJ30_9DEIO|nr:hypothetical protein [Deinococcus aerophilus]GGL97952.1 hypothetical protein GCM10010841_02870 [Deinococcus aerophilus]